MNIPVKPDVRPEQPEDTGVLNGIVSMINNLFKGSEEKISPPILADRPEPLPQNEEADMSVLFKMDEGSPERKPTVLETLSNSNMKSGIKKLKSRTSTIDLEQFTPVQPSKRPV